MSSPRGLFPAYIEDDGRVKFDFPTQAHAFNREYLKGHDVYVEIYKRRGKRSVKQNRWLYAFLKPLAEVLGVTVEELKLIGLVALWGTHDVMGYRVPVKAHTSDLDTEEFSDLCAWYQQKAAERGVLILDPNEWKAAKRKRERAELKKAS